MSDRCTGCTEKYGFFQKPSICPECHRTFCKSCLPYRGKKVKKSQPQISLEPCIYCKKQKEANKREEAEILSNFQERYYKHTHTEPPIQSALRLDLLAKQQSSPGAVARGEATSSGVKLSAEDRALEERLRKLKESHKVKRPDYSEDEIRDRLEKLRDDPSKVDTSAQPSTHGDISDDGNARPPLSTDKKTQVEQSQDLIEKGLDEVRMDERLAETNRTRDEELWSRFQSLKNKSGEESSNKAGQGQSGSIPMLERDSDIQQFLEDMEIEVTSDTPAEQLLNDLKRFQYKEEASALAEAKSGEVQSLIDKAYKLAQKEKENAQQYEKTVPDQDIAEITYPEMPIVDSTCGVDDALVDASDHKPRSKPDNINKEDVTKLVQGAIEEMKQEKEKEGRDAEFIEGAAARLSELRTEKNKDKEDTTISIIPDDEVRSKLGPPKNLDFAWTHFGPTPPSSTSKGNFPALSAARQMGLTDSGSNFMSVSGDADLDDGDEELDDEVQGLVTRMIAEAKLDEKLEASGLESKSTTSDVSASRGISSSSASAQSTKRGESAGAGASVGYWSGPTAVGSSGGACGVGNVDDLPWCCICNNDATLRCFDCDDDLYCTHCFSEGHEQFGLFDHKYAPFEPPRTNRDGISR